MELIAVFGRDPLLGAILLMITAWLAIMLAHTGLAVTNHAFARYSLRLAAAAPGICSLLGLGGSILGLSKALAQAGDPQAMLAAMATAWTSTLVGISAALIGLPAMALASGRDESKPDGKLEAQQ